MEMNEDPIDAWLDELEPDEPLAVQQPPLAPSRRTHPAVMGALGLGVLIVAFLAVRSFVGFPSPAPSPSDVSQIATGGTPSVSTESSTMAPGSTLGAQAGAQTQTPPPDHARDQGGQGIQGPAENQTPADAHGQPSERATASPDDPYDATDGRPDHLAALVASATNQWMTHASAEAMVKNTISRNKAVAQGEAAIQIRAVQSLPLPNVGRLVQVNAWTTNGVNEQWVVPVREDGVVMAEPWIISSAQTPLAELPPAPTGKIDEAEAVQVLTKAGWTQVTLHASGPHPALPDVLIVSFNGIPPEGKTPVPTTLWLGGPAGARHVMGVS